jgi:hypothetical protein
MRRHAERRKLTATRARPSRLVGRGREDGAEPLPFLLDVFDEPLGAVESFPPLGVVVVEKPSDARRARPGGDAMGGPGRRGRSMFAELLALVGP